MKNRLNKQKPVASHPLMMLGVEMWVMGRITYDEHGSPSVSDGSGNLVPPQAGDIERITWYRKALLTKAKYLQSWLKSAQQLSKSQGGPKR